MARNRPTSTGKAHQGSSTQATTHGNGHHSAEAQSVLQDWLNSPLAAPKKAVDSLLEMQCQWLKTANMGNETLALELKELQQAKDPVAFASAQFSLANQQLEIFTRQVASILQQVYDAQLLWIGQWDEKPDASAAAPSPVQQGQSALGALGRMQDEWLKVTQNWVESMNAGSHSR